MKVLKARNEGEDQVLTKAGEIILEKARYKIGDSTRKLSHS